MHDFNINYKEDEAVNYIIQNKLHNKYNKIDPD